MNIILVLGDITPRVVSYIEKLNGVSIKVTKHANTIDDIEDYLVKTLTKADMLVFTDAALGYDYMKSIVKLKGVLESNFLSVDQLIHLTINSSNISTSTEHILGDYGLKVIKRDKYSLKTIIGAITGDLTEFKSDDTDKSLVDVVRVRKNSRDVVSFEESKVNDSVIITTKKKVGLDDKLEALESIKEVKGKKQLQKFNQKISPSKLEQVDQSIQDPKSKNVPLPDLQKEIDLEIGTTIVVTGERKSGKSVLAQALSIAYSDKHKVLLITDAPLIDESIKEGIIPIALEDFKSNLKAAVSKTSVYNDKLHILNNFSNIAEDIKYSLLDIIYFNIKDNYDLIIVDVQLTKYIELPGISSNANLVCITSPLYTSSVDSMVKFLEDMNIYLYKTKFLFVPTNIFNPVGGLKKYNIATTKKAIIDAIKYDNVASLPEIQFKSIVMGQKLIDIISPHLQERRV